jgi:3-hydroxyacyl-CoA dehydrogenase
MEALKGGRIAEFDAMVNRFQQTSMRIKFALVPVVSAIRGMALGGGCEFQMHSAKTVAALESYVGLVEAGVGFPAAAAARRSRCAPSAQPAGGDVSPAEVLRPSRWAQFGQRPR